MIYAVVFIFAAVLTTAVTPFVMRFARRFHVVDDPSVEGDRRIHVTPVPLLGGVGIWLVLVICIGYLSFFRPELIFYYIKPVQLVGFLVGASILMVGGYLDDRYKLKTVWKILFPCAAALLAILSGIGVNFITNPFGGVWRIDSIVWSVLQYGNFNYVLSIGTVFFTLVWLMAAMFTTKVLDGLDGLVTGIAAIGALIIVALCLRPPVLQSDTAIFATMIAGAFVGFLPFNWSPAKIFLGEGGSLLAGYTLGILAVVAGGKIATAGIILAIPLFDAVWVVLRRVFLDRRSPVSPDRSHLHFALIDLGLSVRQVVSFFYMITLASGLLALFLPSLQKLYAVFILGMLFFVGAVYLLFRDLKTSRG
ncbi:MAG: MraY family glycosyltransferase [Patescibacteria group bacterium]|jgi:UDP-GlcNAc:undecaprenyl-phosphate GlcNAc-1-phosphate transferase